MNIEGKRMIRLAEELWPLNRSLSGEGTRESLRILKRELSELEIKIFESGSKVFDWVVPPEWNCYEAYILSPDGTKICDFSNNNLHLVGYSEPIEASVTLAELQEHLFSLPEQPNAIPYVTSYYKRAWGFCLADQDRRLLVEGEYKVIIRSEFSNSGLDYGELVIPGISDREVFFSTYLCHPSMANNELSGPVLAVQLAKHLQKMDNFYTYRFIFIPETIGSIAYMASNLSDMKKNMLAGFVLTCLGDERAYSYIPSRKGGTIADLAALSTFQELGISPILYGWQDRGSDERQYCSPGADLPVCSVTRSKYGSYPEYHTSLDTLGEVVTIDGLQGSFDFYIALISKLETQRFPRMTAVGEPQLGKRGLYPNTSIKDAYADVRSVMDFISMLDGTIETEDAIKKSGVDKAHGHAFLNRLIEEELVEN
jgi:aminopeptidase-like protein